MAFSLHDIAPEYRYQYAQALADLYQAYPGADYGHTDIPAPYRYYYMQALANLYESFPEAEFEHVCMSASPPSEELAAHGKLFRYLHIFFLCDDFEVMQCSDEGFAGWGIYHTYCYESWSGNNGGEQSIVEYWAAQHTNDNVAYVPINNNSGSFQYRSLHLTSQSRTIVYCDTILQFEGVILYPTELTADGTVEPTYSLNEATQTLTLYTAEIDYNTYD